MPTRFSTRLIRWQREHGRHDLPWQQHGKSPYHIWLSEVMLQQTQVVTVKRFYARFIERFPTVAQLAAAPLDEVLALWSGMGYYTRARNLHRAARYVMEDCGGVFPQTAQALEALPGVGRSTAAAIAAFCYGERVAILDGNVKRVLARVLGFEGDLAQSARVRELWELATELLPTQDLPAAMPTYTQALMDIGATRCHARSPVCISCPAQPLCKANTQKAWEAYPVKTKKLKRTVDSVWLLQLTNASGEVLLMPRPLDAPSKIWAGLHCLPLFSSEAQMLAFLQGAFPTQTTTQTPHAGLKYQAPFKHVLTHKDLWLYVATVCLPAKGGGHQRSQGEPPSTNPHLDEKGAMGQWYSIEEALKLGLPAPIRRMLSDH